ncbi:unnamed protein product [Prunus brigantina]
MIVAERGTYLGRQVHGLSYKAPGIYRKSPGEPFEAEKDLPEGLKNICLVESEWGKWVVQSAFGIVKHGGERKMLDKTWLFPPINRCYGRGKVPSSDLVLLGTNIAPTSLDSSVVAWAEAEWIPRDGPFAFSLSK